MKLFEFLQRSMSEDNGNPSAMRVNTFIVVLQFSIVLSVGFLWTIWKHPDMTLAYAGLLLSVILGVLGIKTWQKGKEETVVTPVEKKEGEA